MLIAELWFGCHFVQTLSFSVIEILKWYPNLPSTLFMYFKINLKKFHLHPLGSFLNACVIIISFPFNTRRITTMEIPMCCVHIPNLTHSSTCSFYCCSWWNPTTAPFINSPVNTENGYFLGEYAKYLDFAFHRFSKSFPFAEITFTHSVCTGIIRHCLRQQRQRVYWIYTLWNKW